MANSGKKIAVIGAGIIGVNCAYQLQKSGYQVTLIDKSGVAEGCSKGNAGHFATEQVFPLADSSLLSQLPKMLLDPLGPIALSPRYTPKVLPWFIRFFNQMRPSKFSHNQSALTTLNQSAINAYEVLLEEIGAEHLLTKNGSFLVFEHPSVKSAEKVATHYKNANIELELISGEQARSLEPSLSENIQHAIWFKDVGHTFSPFELTKVIADAAFKLGAAFEQSTVRAVEHHGQVSNSNDDDRITLVLEEKRMQFDQVIVATGGYSKSLVESIGYQLPIEVERGYSFDLSINPNTHDTKPAHEKDHGQTSETARNTYANSRLKRPVASAERKFIITPMQDAGNNILRLSGTVEFAGLDAPANMKRASLLHNHAKEILQQLPTAPTNNENKWMGFRPSLPDSLPVMCQAPRHKGLYFCLGHQHLGLTQGAISGLLMKQLIAGEATTIDLTPFNISRFN